MPLLLASGVVAYLVMPHVDEMLAEWFRGDVELNASLIASSIEDRLVTLVERRDIAGMRRYLSRVAADKHLAEVLVCGPDNEPLYQTSLRAPEVTCGLAAAPLAGASQILHVPSGTLHVAGFVVPQEGRRAFKIFVVHDLGFATTRQTQARRYLLALSAIAVIVFGLLLVLVAWSVVKRWAALLIGDIRSRRFLDDAHSSGLSLPVLSQVRQAMREIEQSQRLEIEYQENWTAQALHQVVR
jgi:hypothetical protein